MCHQLLFSKLEFVSPKSSLFSVKIDPDWTSLLLKSVQIEKEMCRCITYLPCVWRICFCQSTFCWLSQKWDEHPNKTCEPDPRPLTQPVRSPSCPRTRAQQLKVQSWKSMTLDCLDPYHRIVVFCCYDQSLRLRTIVTNPIVWCMIQTTSKSLICTEFIINIWWSVAVVRSPTWLTPVL